MRASVLEAAVTELSERGYEGFSLPGVARRAGVAPSTLRRRWQDKQGLILDLATELTSGMVPDPGTSSLRDDLLAVGESVACMLADPTIVSLLRAAFALPPAELEELRRRFWPARVQVAQDIIDRAADRGEVPPGTNGWSIAEPIYSTIWMRLLITGFVLDQAVIDDLVERALAQARGASPR